MSPTEQRGASLDAFESALAAHDAALRALGVEIWIGNEPTFTRRSHETEEWVTGALGADKLACARGSIARLSNDRPGSLLLRSIGRQYPGEAWPRWSIGAYASRDGAPLWTGPPDPLLAQVGSANLALGPFLDRLGAALRETGFACRTFRGERDLRLLYAHDASRALPEPDSDARLKRASIHAAPPPAFGLHDELAADGLFLLIVSVSEEGEPAVPVIDLPALPSVAAFRRLLQAAAEAARQATLPALMWRGFAPPVDGSVAWTTVTPDPAVLEMNMAPSPDATSFWRESRRAYAAAAGVGLEPLRFGYNGLVYDSGGGGQITVGGPAPERSPFFVQPRLLPRVVRYVIRHPSLSYLFAHDYVGPSGQSVRADECGTDAHDHLRLALALLGGDAPIDRAALWGTLAPCLSDATGNHHRSELNIEKLWNPHQPGRGQLGLVEFRSFRMQHTPERAAALGALLRAIVARLMQGSDSDELVEWGPELHERFALPFYLEADLREVLADLAGAGLGLEPALTAELERDPFRHWASVELGGATLTVRRALEFWPLLGDASDQQGTCRLVDASTSRIELALRPEPGGSCDDWQLRVSGMRLPLRVEHEPRGAVGVFGVRYRSFLPRQGLYPTLGAQTPLELLALGPEQQRVQIALHEWRPDGGLYDGLPRDAEDARLRRAARCKLQPWGDSPVPAERPAPRLSLGAYALDLRYVAAQSARLNGG